MLAMLLFSANNWCKKYRTLPNLLYAFVLENNLTAPILALEIKDLLLIIDIYAILRDRIV